MDVWTVIVTAALGASSGVLGTLALSTTKFGEAWLKSRFDKAIEAFKSEQAQKLEHLREEIGHRGDRGKRSIELEFAAIQEVWEKVNEAVLATGASVGGYMSHADLSNTSGPRI